MSYAKKKVVKECLKNSSKEAKRTSKTATNSNKNSLFSFDAFIFFIKNKTQIALLNIVEFAFL